MKIKFKKEPRKVVLARYEHVHDVYQKNKMDGMKAFVGAFSETIDKSYFVDKSYGTTKTSRSGGAVFVQYDSFPGANKPDKKGRKKFKKGAIVSRTGGMHEEFKPPIYFSGNNPAVGRAAKSKGDVRFEVTENKMSIDISGRTARLMGIHINKNRIRIVELALKRMKKVFADKIQREFNKSAAKTV
jgi:hypothetical protein